MSYLMVMFLFHFNPYESFKCFCNLVLGKQFMYRTYQFELSYIQNINVCLEHLISKYYFELYSFLKERAINLWQILWIEWIYAMFLRTFDVETCQILWDLILVRGDIFVFKLTFEIFGMINRNFESLDKNSLMESIRALLLSNSKRLLQKLAH